MTGRTRNLGLSALVIGGSLVFGVGFAGAQAPANDPAPKSVQVDASDDSTFTGTGSGSSGCDHGEPTTALNASDL